MAVVINGTTGITTPTESVATTIGVGGATPSASGAGITFPATQSASSDVNTLDDYEEGTWTPILNAGVTSLTYGEQSGRYVKIGSRVFFDIRLLVSGTGNSSQISINNFPFATNSNLPNCGAFATYVDIAAGDNVWYMSNGSTQIQAYVNGTPNPYTVSGTVTSKYIIITGNYSV